MAEAKTLWGSNANDVIAVMPLNQDLTIHAQDGDDTVSGAWDLRTGHHLNISLGKGNDNAVLHLRGRKSNEQKEPIVTISDSLEDTSGKDSARLVMDSYFADELTFVTNASGVLHLVNMAGNPIVAFHGIESILVYGKGGKVIQHWS